MEGKSEQKNTKNTMKKRNTMMITKNSMYNNINTCLGVPTPIQVLLLEEPEGTMVRERQANHSIKTTVHTSDSEAHSRTTQVAVRMRIRSTGTFE